MLAFALGILVLGRGAEEEAFAFLSRGCGLVVLGIQTSVFQPGWPIGWHRGGLCCGLVSQGHLHDPLRNPLWLLTWEWSMEGFLTHHGVLVRLPPSLNYSLFSSGEWSILEVIYLQRSSGFDAGKQIDFLKKTSHHLSPVLRPYCLHPFSTQEAWHLLFWGCLLVCLATPCGLQDHSFPTQHRTWVLAVNAPSSNHQTARKSLIWSF